MKFIYLVIGEAGEYADRCEWCVKAFGDREKADQFTQLCQDESDELHRHLYDDNYFYPHKHTLDPLWRGDYWNRTRYTVTEITFEE